jgi:heptosyltransferase-2
MLKPSISSLKKIDPELNIHLVASSNTCAELLNDDSKINSNSVMNIGYMRSILKYIKGGLAIRSLKPDAIIAAAGTDPVGGSLISIFSGAHTRIGEDWMGRGLFYSDKIKVNLQIPEVEQNFKLVKLLNPQIEYHCPRIDLTEEEKKFAVRWRDRLNLPVGSKLLGIHPGSGKNQKWKRWKLEKFFEVVKVFSKRDGITPVIFIGPDEKELLKKFADGDLYGAIISAESNGIRKTAAKIGCCDFFLSNDSGLRHIAAAQKIRTVGIFGPTSRVKNFYNDGKSRIIYRKDVACSPCHYTKWWLSCGKARPCLEKISVTEVVDAVLKMIA